MHKLDIKPLSVNQAWQGKRFKTPAYKSFERECLLKLKQVDIPEGRLYVHYIWGFSSKNSDYDNPIKCFQDVLQSKYGFNDSRIYDAVICKRDVKKGEEYIQFAFYSTFEEFIESIKASRLV